MKAQTLVETNPIADWLDFNIVYSEGYRTNIGVAQRDKDRDTSTWYLNTEKWLYPNYTEYCHNTGSRSIGLRRFVNLLSDLCLNQLGCLVEKGRDRYGSYFLGLKIRGKGDEDAPLFVTGLFNTTSNTEVDIGTVTDDVTDRVTDGSIGGDESNGCYGKTYNLFNLEIQLARVEQYTTAMEKELEEKENLENHQSVTISNPIPDDEDEELKVGDKVIYVGKKYRESIGNQVMEVIKIKKHWTGNQITCKYHKGWTTWIPESSLKRV